MPAQYTILIADDEPYILHVLSIKLTNAGFAVTTAADGREALELCLSEDPDLVITDYQMPGLTGTQWYRQAMETAGRSWPAILLTAREFDIDPAEIEDIGFDALLAKPFSPRKVCQAVERLLAGANPLQKGDVA